MALRASRPSRWVLGYAIDALDRPQLPIVVHISQIAAPRRARVGVFNTPPLFRMLHTASQPDWLDMDEVMHA